VIGDVRWAGWFRGWACEVVYLRRVQHQRAPCRGHVVRQGRCGRFTRVFLAMGASRRLVHDGSPLVACPHGAKRRHCALWRVMAKPHGRPRAKAKGACVGFVRPPCRCPGVGQNNLRGIDGPSVLRIVSFGARLPAKDPIFFNQRNVKCSDLRQGFGGLPQLGEPAPWLLHPGQSRQQLEGMSTGFVCWRLSSCHRNCWPPRQSPESHKH